jgi:RNA polymerase sigma factor (sigma-70 family)
MNHDENALLLSTYRADPSLRNRNRVVTANLGLVEKAADRFAKVSRIPFDDLYGAGCIGLIKAVEMFDLLTGNKFSSYAMPRIRGEMMHHQRDREQPGGIKIPRKWIDNRKKLLTGDFTGIKPEDVAAAAQAVQYHEPTSLDHSGGDEDDGPGIQLAAPEHSGTLPTTIELLIMPLFTPPDKADYFNATQIAQRYGRQISHWRQIPRTVSLLKEFNCKENGKPAIISKRGRNGETWVHRDLSADFLRWVSPEAAALVCYAYSAAVGDRLAG